jgi:hypothetical protein
MRVIPGELVWSMAMAWTLFCRQDGVDVVRSFPGDSAIGPKATPDNVGAVGPRHAVDFTCANFVVHDKETGKVLQKKTQEQFWKELGFPGIRPNDPRMLFDSLSGRFVATIADDTVHHLYLAVSASPDPTEPWKGVQTPFDSPDFGFRMGVDRNGLYGCWWNRNRDIHIMMDCCAIPKMDLLAPGGPDLKGVQIFRNLELEAFPATDLNPDKSPEAPEILLHHEFARAGSFSKLYLYRITWSGRTASISGAQEIPLRTTYFCPNGASQENLAVQPAPGGRLRVDEGRRTSCVYAHGGSVFSCNAAKRDPASRCGIFWCEVRVSDGSVLQESLVDAADCDYLAPSLAVDGAGNLGIGCTRSSSSEFPSACVMGRSPAGPKGAVGHPRVSVKGTTVYVPAAPPKYGIGWGNYNSTCVDPVDPTLLWTSQEYAASATPGQFSTCWTAFRVKPENK